jgi:hypothetical protein
VGRRKCNSGEEGKEVAEKMKYKRRKKKRGEGNGVQEETERSGERKEVLGRRTGRERVIPEFLSRRCITFVWVCKYRGIFLQLYSQFESSTHVKLYPYMKK